MEWRCTWCGKPHEEDDPPCDNCGHNTFERAVEQMAPEPEDTPSDPVWVCTECGRQHTKNSPPCKRCGNVDLEKRQPDWDDLDELGGTSYRDVLEPRYVVGYAIAAVLGLTLVLGYAGVITLPGAGRPAVPDAPGEGEQVGDIAIDGVEATYVERLNDRRSEANVAPLANDSDLAWYTAYVNKRLVANVTGDGPPLSQEDVNRVNDYCDRRPLVDHYRLFSVGSVADFENESALAGTLLEGWDRTDEVLDESQRSVGVDVHVGEDDQLFVTVAVC